MAEATYQGNVYQTPDGSTWLRAEPAVAGAKPTWIKLTTQNQIDQAQRVYGTAIPHGAINYNDTSNKNVVYGLHGSAFEGVTNFDTGSGSAGGAYWQRPAAGEEPEAEDDEEPTNPFETENALAYVRELFPWLDQMGLTETVRQLVVEGRSPAAIVQTIRNTSQYQARFVAIKRPDGTMRMNEAEYLKAEDNYRQVLKQFGRAATEFDQPNDYRGLFEMEIDPNELRDRFQIFDQIQANGGAVKDAFFVYAGMELSDEDLYRAVVNPEVAQQLTQSFDEATTNGNLDYQTWINRARQVGLNNVTNILRNLKKGGINTDGALAAIRGINPAFADQLMGALHTGGQQPPAGQNPGQQQPVPFLALNELLRSFEYAMLGSAASQQGFVLPSKERLEAFRAAGVNRARLLEGYGEMAVNGNWYQAAIDRRFRRDLTFGQGEFEKALFLASADERQILEQGLKFEEAFSRNTTGPSGFGMSRTGRLEQQGLRVANPF